VPMLSWTNRSQNEVGQKGQWWLGSVMYSEIHNLAGVAWKAAFNLPGRRGFGLYHGGPYSTYGNIA
jgi:hypothetical protein